MLFTSNRSRYKDDVLNINVYGSTIEQVKEVKYLGLYLDSQLSFNLHIKKLCTKINVRTKLMWCLRSFISLDLAKMLYRSLIQPHFLYCSFILEGTTHTNLSNLQVQQNCALRAVKGVDPIYSGECLRELNIDSVNIMTYKSACKFAYEGFYDLGPPVLNGMFELSVSEQELRSNEQLLALVPRCHTKFGEQNFRYRVVIYWNRLPVEMKMATLPDNFKLVLKTYKWPD